MVWSGVGSGVFTFVSREVCRLCGHWFLIFFYKECGDHVRHGFFLKYRTAVLEDNTFEMKQLFWLKFETMNEVWVKFWRFFVCEISRVFDFR